MITKEQLQARKNSLGSSDAGIVTGFSKYMTPYELWEIKTGKKEPEQDNEREINPKVIGNLLESAVLEMYAKCTGYDLVIPENTRQHPNLPWLTANLDGIIHTAINAKPWIVEAKTASKREGWGQEGTDQIPNHYLMQVCHQALVCDVDRVDIAVLFHGSDFKIYTYYSNRDLEEAYLKIAKEFWSHVQNKTPPEPTNISDLLSIISPNVKKDESMVASEDLVAIYQHIRALNDNIGALAKEVEENKMQLLKAMRTSDTLRKETGEVIARISKIERNTVDTAKLKREFDDVYRKLLKTSTITTIRVF